MNVRIKKNELKRRVAKVATDPLRKLKVWILFPYLETDDPNLQYYYDFSQSHEEYSKVFNELGADWEWQPVTINNFKEIIASLKKKSGKKDEAYKDAKRRLKKLEKGD